MKFDRKTPIIIISLVFVSIIIIGIAPSFVSASQKLVATEDAFVLSGSPNDNYGGFMMIFAGDMDDPSGFGVSGNPGYCESYLYFDLSTISNNFKKAVLIVPGGIGPYDGFTLDAYLTSSLWYEYTVTWNTKPSLNAFIGSAPLYFYPNWEFPKYDITSLVSTYDEISICLRAPSAVDTIFYTLSREYGEIEYENLPYILISTSVQIPGYLLGCIMITIGVCIAIYVYKLKSQLIN